MSIHTIQRAFSAAKTQQSMVLATKNYATKNSTDKTILALSLVSFGIAAGIHKLCTIYQEYQKQKEFVLFVKEALKTRSNVGGAMQQISAPYEGSVITISANNNSPLKMMMDGKSVYLDGYQSIDQFLDTIESDMYKSPELYTAFDVDLAEPLKPMLLLKEDLSSLPLDVQADDVILSTQVTKVSSYNDTEVAVMSCSNGKTYYCKLMERPTDGATVSHSSGIDPNTPKYGLRSFFTHQYCQLLGFDVIPDTKFIQYKDVWYYGLEEVSGKEAACYSSITDPTIIKKTIELQILDALTGQGDRHYYNYFIDPIKKIVKGIDNDLCAGSRVTHQHSIVKRAGFHAFYGVWLPPVLDTEIIDKIKGVSEEEVKNMMKSCRFTQNEIDAGVSRLRGLKDHIRVLEARQKLIDDPSSVEEGIIKKT